MTGSAQAEAVGQLVEARTGAAADAALAGLDGGLASTVSSVRAAVIQVPPCRACASYIAQVNVPMWLVCDGIVTAS